MDRAKPASEENRRFFEQALRQCADSGIDGAGSGLTDTMISVDG